MILYLLDSSRVFRFTEGSDVDGFQTTYKFTLTIIRYLCNYTAVHPARSTSQDGVIFTHNCLSKLLLQAMISLRHVDKNCRIILLMQDSFNISNKAKKMLKILDAEIYFTKEILEPEYNQLKPVIRRFYSEKAWLKLYGKHLNRVFHSDSTDVFFAGSPFNSLRLDTLYFISEGLQVGRCPWNGNWMRSLVGNDEYQKLDNKMILNGGSIGGSCKEYIKFLDVFTQKNYTDKCLKHDNCDQPLVIWLVYTGKLKDIKFDILNCSSGYAIMTYCKPNIIDQNPFTTWYPFKVSYFHQFNRYLGSIAHFNSLCRVGNHFS